MRKVQISKFQYQNKSKIAQLNFQKFNCWTFMLGTYLVICIWLFVAAAQVIAASSTSSATESSDLKTKLKILQDEIASKAAKLKQEMGQKLQNKIAVGMLKEKTQGSWTIQTNQGNQAININNYTTYLIKGKKIDSKIIEKNDWITALGEIDDQGILTAKQIIKLTSIPQEKLVVWGKVLALDDRILTLETTSRKTQAFTLNQQIVIQMGKRQARLVDIKIGKPVIVTANKTNADFVYIFPYSIPLKNITPTATPTGTLKPTPTAIRKNTS